MPRTRVRSWSRAITVEPPANFADDRLGPHGICVDEPLRRGPRCMPRATHAPPGRHRGGCARSAPARPLGCGLRSAWIDSRRAMRLSAVALGPGARYRRATERRSARRKGPRPGCRRGVPATGRTRWRRRRSLRRASSNGTRATGTTVTVATSCQGRVVPQLRVTVGAANRQYKAVVQQP